MTQPPASAARTRTWWVVGVLGVLLMSGLAVWFGLAASAGRVHWVNTGHAITSDTEVQVRFDLMRDPQRPVTCLVQALDERHGTVGTTEVRVGPAASSPSRHIESVSTVSRALTGYVERCWYADEEPPGA